MTHSDVLPPWAEGQHRVQKAIFRGRCPVHGTQLELSDSEQDCDEIYQAVCGQPGCGFAIQIIRGDAA